MSPSSARRSAPIALLLGLVGAFVVACGGAPGATPSPTANSTPSPSASPSVAPATAAPPAETPTPSLSFTATPVGAIRGPFGVSGVVPFDRGYVAWGTIDDAGTFATWYSADGTAWAQAIHSKPIVPCPGYDPRADFESVYQAATVGGKVVLVGSLAVPDEAECDRRKTVALVTADGTTWERSAPFGPQVSMWEWSQNVWAVPEGVEALVESEQKPGTIWRSSDGLTWTETGLLESPPEAQGVVYGASPDGTRLASRLDPESPGGVVTSKDGARWTEVTGLPGDFRIFDVIPPQQAGGRWLLSMVREEPEEARLLSSVDLATWESVTFPKPGISSLISTPDGFLAIGFLPQRDTGCGDDCRPSEPAVYASADGMTWTKQFDITQEFGLLVAGPAGTLMFENREGEVLVSRVAAGN